MKAKVKSWLSKVASNNHIGTRQRTREKLRDAKTLPGNVQSDHHQGQFHMTDSEHCLLISGSLISFSCLD